MSRFAAFAIVASACLNCLHGQERNTEKKISSALSTSQGSGKGTAEAISTPSSTAEKIQKTPKKIVIGGASMDLFRPSKKFFQPHPAGKVRGWRLGCPPRFRQKIQGTENSGDRRNCSIFHQILTGVVADFPACNFMLGKVFEAIYGSFVWLVRQDED